MHRALLDTDKQIWQCGGVQGTNLRKFAGVALVIFLIHLNSCFNMLELYLKYYDKSDDFADDLNDKCEDEQLDLRDGHPGGASAGRAR